MREASESSSGTALRNAGDQAEAAGLVPVIQHVPAWTLLAKAGEEHAASGRQERELCQRLPPPCRTIKVSKDQDQEELKGKPLENVNGGRDIVAVN